MNKHTNHSNDKYIVGSIFTILMVACGLAIWFSGDGQTTRTGTVSTSSATSTSDKEVATSTTQNSSTASDITVKTEPVSPLDQFANCLSQKGAKMYGTYWCAHCNNQKKLFGESFKFVSYVECTDDMQYCINQGISGFPTWVLADGTKLEGEKSLAELAQATSCPLPK